VLLGQNLGAVVKAKSSINACGAYVTPGGIDSHVHIEDDIVPASDTFETGSRSAIAGGTTTILSFAQQNRGDESVIPIVDAYHGRARDNTYCDYGFHLIMSNPTPKVLNEELPILARQRGITSVKLFMTYQPLMIPDNQILDVMLATRKLGVTTMVHAENGDIIEWITQKLEEQKLTDPYYHAVSRPKLAEDEATHRVISLAELMDIPILIVHMSSKIAAEHVRNAQTRLMPIHAETCPQYLYLTSERLKAHGFEGAKCVCSPPLREDEMDLDAMWQGLSNGTFTTFSSDHAGSK
jgi:dihydropyrimidinase